MSKAQKSEFEVFAVKVVVETVLAKHDGQERLDEIELLSDMMLIGLGLRS